MDVASLDISISLPNKTLKIKIFCELTYILYVFSFPFDLQVHVKSQLLFWIVHVQYANFKIQITQLYIPFTRTCLKYCKADVQYENIKLI